MLKTSHLTKCILKSGLAPNKQTKNTTEVSFDGKSGCHGNVCAKETITMQITYNCQCKYSCIHKGFTVRGKTCTEISGNFELISYKLNCKWGN